MAIDYMTIVSSAHPIPESWTDQIALIESENAFGERFLVEKKTLEAFLKLRRDLLTEDGIQIELDSVFRSIDQQIELIERFKAEFGETYAEKFCAKPGTSEHHTGLAVDIGVVIDGRFVNDNDEMIANRQVFSVIHAKIARYGFILTCMERSGMTYEPWHLRYIDHPEAAEIIMDKKLTLSEYLKDLPVSLPAE
ncbi:MAG: M15 family metallopeptidase [Clostridia bacterium]|nr:M15 family metallopeptidase [Clostridia bacterium]